MDIDDDRILTIDTTDGRRLNNFKVPKKNLKIKSSFDRISLDSSEFKENIYSKIITGFKNPHSISCLKVVSSFNICNVEVESLFNKRKQYFKKEYSPQSATEYFGFIYISNIVELRKIVEHGRIKNGNIRESVLGQADMGISVSQYSDIYHHGDNKNYPRTGFLLLVKYMRGRVCYVVEDNSPMEPQPNYDCHMSKVYNHESFPSVGRAFHTTQVYLYEYTDDFDLMDEPSHIMPWAAVEFIWSGPLLYKLVNVPIAVVNDSLFKDPTSKAVDKRIRLLTRPTGSPTQRIKQLYTDCTPIHCTQLQLKSSNSKEETTENVVLDIPVTILSYHLHWRPFGPLMSSTWPICELIEWMSFEQEFLKPLIKNPLNDSFSLNDVFNKRITLNRNSETKITSAEDCLFVNYLRMVVSDPSRDRARMARFIEYFHETKTVGRIRLCDSASSMLFIFPDSTLSQNFGIPSVKTLDVNYLHILVVTEKSLAYNHHSDLIDEFLEVELKTSLLKLYDAQNIGTTDLLVPMHILKQSLKNQNHVQKLKLRQMCGLQRNDPLVFNALDFEKKEDVIALEEVSQTTPVMESNDSEITVQNIDTKEDADDRPYDPVENLMGLRDVSSLNKVKQIRKAEKSPDEPPAKVLNVEEKKSELNTKLMELFAKIEHPTESGDVMPEQTQGTEYVSEEHQRASLFGRTSPQPVVFSKSLDRNRFQTQYRHGVSLYVPQPTVIPPEDTEHPRDIDLRLQNPNRYPFYYFDDAMKHSGVNR